MTRQDVFSRLGGVENMQADLELVSIVTPGHPAYRIYGWEGPWVTVGATQATERAFVEGQRVPWVRRPTGGKAVFHGHDVTVGLAVHLQDIGLEPSSRNVHSVYEYLTSPLRNALQPFESRIVSGEGGGASQVKGADCFAYTSPNDISFGFRKVCGCAQRIYANVALLQASIPIRQPLIAPDLVLVGAAAPLWIEVDEQELVQALIAQINGLA